MLYQIIAITIKDLKILVRDRGGMTSLFLMPVMFILVMSYAMQGSYEIGSGEKPIELLVVNMDEGALAAEAIEEMGALDGMVIVDRLDDGPLSEQQADDLVAAGDYPVALIFPANFSAQVLQAATDPQAEETTVIFIVDPSMSSQFLAPIQGTVQGYIQMLAAYAQAPLQIKAGFEGIAEEVPAEQAIMVGQIGDAFVEHIGDGGGFEEAGSLGVRFEAVAPQSFEVQEFPTSVEQNVPGYTIFGVFFIVQVLATSLLSEKQEGTFRRLLIAPLP
ncbi:MAG: ABC transporter permease, partial [Anaerolineae bacterium]|nr:ABC transporter permease [Anaerolineae bacterium]